MLFDGTHYQQSYRQSYSTFNGLQKRFIGSMISSRCWLMGLGQSSKDEKWNCSCFKLTQESVISQGDPT